MNTKLVVINLIIFLSLTLFQVSAEESYLAPLAKRSLLLDYAKGSNAFVVGERGHVMRAPIDFSSVDDFTQLSIPSTITLTAVDSIDKNVWLVGHDATILLSNDAGESWDLKFSEASLDRPFLDLKFFDKNEGIAVGAYGLFFRSTDGGNTWTQESHPSVLSNEDIEYLESIKDEPDFYLEELSYISPHFNKLYQDNNELYLAGEAGLIAKSDDRGRSWQRLEIDYYGSFFDINTLPNGDILAVGLRGHMFVQHKGEWQSIETCISTTLNQIVKKEDSIYIVGNNGLVLSLEYEKLLGDETVLSGESCQRNAAIKRVNTNFSDAIMHAAIIEEQIIVITSGGLRQVVID